MTYTVEIAESADRVIARSHKRKVLRQKIDSLATNPHPQQAIPLQGEKDRWRLRIADYRVTYRIDDERRIVRILDVETRGHAYRD